LLFIVGKLRPSLVELFSSQTIAEAAYWAMHRSMLNIAVGLRSCAAVLLNFPHYLSTA
jgi:hypothetical protein